MTTQFGEVRVIDGGTLLAAPALDLAGALCTADEMGLLGVALDPGFAAAGGYVYLYYTRSKSGRCVNRVSRFAMSGTTIDAGSELVLVDEIPATGNHNAGDIRFGKDGYLYVSVGDGGCDHAGDSGCAGQNDASRDEHVLVGKILRITADGRHSRVESFPGRRHRPLQRHRAHDRRQPLPGDVRLGAPKPVPVRVRPERGLDALLRQRRRPGSLGGDRPRPGGRRLRLERP